MIVHIVLASNVRRWQRKVGAAGHLEPKCSLNQAAGRLQAKNSERAVSAAEATRPA